MEPSEQLKGDPNGKTGGSPPHPEIIDASAILKPQPLRPYHEMKDQRITTLAVAVIGLAAFVASTALLGQFFMQTCGADGSCIPALPDWPEEMLRLALVASLAFVMGSGGKQS